MFLELVYYSFGLYFILQVCYSSSAFGFGVLVLVASFIENKHFLLKFACDIFRFLRILFYFSIRSAFLRKLLVFCLGYWWGCCSCELDSWDLPEPSSLAFSTVIVSSVLRPGYLAVKFFSNSIITFLLGELLGRKKLLRCVSNIIYFAIFFSLSKCLKYWAPVILIFSADSDLLHLVSAMVIPCMY